MGSCFPPGCEYSSVKQKPLLITQPPEEPVYLVCLLVYLTRKCGYRKPPQNLARKLSTGLVPTALIFPSFFDSQFHSVKTSVNGSNHNSSSSNNNNRTGRGERRDGVTYLAPVCAAATQSPPAESSRTRLLTSEAAPAQSSASSNCPVSKTILE